MSRYHALACEERDESPAPLVTRSPLKLGAAQMLLDYLQPFADSAIYGRGLFRHDTFRPMISVRVFD